MAYREDDDLKFLGEMESEALSDLVDVLTKDKDGSARLTQELTSSDLYKQHAPDHNKYWELIAAEIQLFGGNTIVSNVFRLGKGVLYREVLQDACDKLKVQYAKHAPVENIEAQLLAKLFAGMMDKMSADEREEFAKVVGLEAVKTFAPEAMAAAVQAAIIAGGFASYRIALIVANQVSRALLGRGLTFAANATLARTIGVISGPIGWAVTGAWTLVDIASPAFRVTLPAVVHVALLRKMHRAKVEGLIKELEKELAGGAAA